MRVQLVPPTQEERTDQSEASTRLTGQDQIGISRVRMRMETKRKEKKQRKTLRNDAVSTEYVDANVSVASLSRLKPTLAKRTLADHRFHLIRSFLAFPWRLRGSVSRCHVCVAGGDGEGVFPGCQLNLRKKEKTSRGEKASLFRKLVSCSDASQQTGARPLS